MTTDEHFTSGLALYRKALSALGAEPSQADTVFDAIWQSGLQPRRFFHNPAHYLAVGGGEQALQREADGKEAFKKPFEALRFKAGCDHDVVYVHIDRKAADEQHHSLHPSIRPYIERFAHIEEHEDGCITLTFNQDTLDESHKNLLEGLNIIFQQSGQESAELKWYQNQNEYLSALFAIASGLEQGLSQKYLLAECAMIEATVPFGAPNRLPELEKRLREASLQCGNLLTEDELRQTIAQAEAISNRDVGDFQKPFSEFIANSFLLLLENSIGKVSGKDAYAIDTVTLATAMSGMADFLSAIAEASQQNPAPRSIFHLADGSRHPQEATAIANIRSLADYLREARLDLQLLNTDFNHDRLQAPKNWGEICHFLGVNTANATKHPLSLFHTIGSETLAAQHAKSEPTSVDKQPSHAICQRLKTLKATIIQDERQAANTQQLQKA